jgi:hypothetical protein
VGGPTASHAIASAAHTVGVPLARTGRNDLAATQHKIASPPPAAANADGAEA